MHVRALLLLAMTLGGCSMSGVPDWISDDAAGPEPTNYRFIVANALVNGVSGVSAVSGVRAIIGRSNVESLVLEISNPRRVDVAKGATWMVCVRTLSYPARLPRAYHSVFIRHEKIIDARISVGIDQCERETYTPFEWSVDVDNPTLR